MLDKSSIECRGSLVTSSWIGKYSSPKVSPVEGEYNSVYLSCSRSFLMVTTPSLMFLISPRNFEFENFALLGVEFEERVV